MTSSAPALPLATDFSDWLSPILVKELRQGLKSRVFAGSFIVMQVVMILTMGLRLLEQSERGTGADAASTLCSGRCSGCRCCCSCRRAGSAR